MELWDLYDKDEKLTGKVMERGTLIPEGYFHLVVHIWIKNSDGLFLISRRSKDRASYPLKLECQGGSVLAGETSLEGAIRETKEEVGIDLSNISGKKIFHKNRPHFRDMMDVWLFHYDGEVDLNKATTKEVCETMWLSYDEIKDLLVSGELVPTLDYFFDINKDELGDIK
jgi:8-oxo-dGTP pyrophosphatase MutT (NUDIX family)